LFPQGRRDAETGRTFDHSEDDLKDTIKYIHEQLAESARIKTELASTSSDLIRRAAEIAVACLRSGGKILICGNGGSAADSQHIAAEMVGRFRMNRKGLPAVALTTDTSVLLSIGNDYGFDEIFKRQIEALGAKGDLLIGLSTSGNSANVVKAAEQAESSGLHTVALVGAQNCRLDGLAGLVIHVPSDDAARIQESHIAVGHVLCDLIERAFFGGPDGAAT
jgi:D-sedoheptulose 7-phosphate isomerase